MFRNKMLSLIFVIFISGFFVISCSKKSTDEADAAVVDDGVAVDSAPVVNPITPNPNVAASAVAPSRASNIEGTPEAVKLVEDAKKKDAEYQGEVVLKIKEGGVQYNAIKSKSKCQTAQDCTYTKYANVPKIDRDCTCAAACTPFVVNRADKKLREEANEKLCDQNDWYGATCPAPPCSFMGFTEFQ